MLYILTELVFVIWSNVNEKAFVTSCACSAPTSVTSSYGADVDAMQIIVRVLCDLAYAPSLISSDP